MREEYCEQCGNKMTEKTIIGFNKTITVYW